MSHFVVQIQLQLKHLRPGIGACRSLALLVGCTCRCGRRAAYTVQDVRDILHLVLKQETIGAKHALGSEGNIMDQEL